MACCLTAPGHYLNQCWLIISKVEWHSSKGNFTRDTSAINHWDYLTNQVPKMSFKFPRGNELSYFRMHCSCALLWRHNGHGSISNHQPHDCFLNRLFRRRSKKLSKLRVTGLCAGNSPETGEFPAQMASNTENVSIWWRHHGWCRGLTHKEYVLFCFSVVSIYLRVINQWWFYTKS